MMRRFRKLILGPALALLAGLFALNAAWADFNFTQGTGSTMFSVTATTGGGTALCAAASTHCYAMVPINTAGAGLFVTGNAGLVTGTGGTFPATQSGTWNITNISGTISLPTGAATAAKQPALGTAGTASTDVITVQGIAAMTPLLAAQSGTWNITNISGTISLPTGAATAANQTNASQKTQIVDGSGNVIASTSNNLNVQCANCSGSGVSTADQATFTAGSSLFAGGGGFFQTTATNNPLTTGQQGMFQVTAQRALFANLRNASGTEIGTSTTPVQVSLANTGSNATAVLTTGTGGTFPATQSGTWNITNISGTVSLPTGASTAANQTSVIGTKNAGTAATNSLLAGAVFNNTPLTLTDTQMASLQADANGFLKVNVAAGGASGGTSSNFGSAFPTPGTAVGFTDGTNMVSGRVGNISNATAATNFINTIGACQYNATPPTVTDTRFNIPNCDVNANLRVNVVAATGLAQGSTTSGQTGSLIMAAVTTGAPSYTTAQTSPLSLTTTGDLRMVFSNTTIAVTNAGTFAVQPASATAPVSTMNSASAAAGVNSAMAAVFDDTSPTAITENNFGFVRMSANRNQYTTLRDAAGNERGANVNANNALSVAFDQTTLGTTNGVALVPPTAAVGTTTTSNIVPNNTTGVNIKNAAGQVYGYEVYSIAASQPAWLKLYNSSSAPTCGSGTPVRRILIPASATGAGAIRNTNLGIAFSTGIGYCITTGIGDADTTAPAANTYVVNLDTK